MNKVNNLNSAINSTKVGGSLNVSSEVNFPKNQVLDAILLDKKPNGEALLRIGKHSVKAQMPQNVFVRPGDSFKLQVIGKEKDIWNFRFISINRSSIFYKISPELVNSHLIKLKLPITDNSFEIAKALFKYNLNLSAENYKSLLPFANTNSKLYLEAAAFLKSLNITPNQTNVKIMYEFLSNNTSFSNILYSIYALLTNQPNNVNPFVMGIIQTFIANIIKDPYRKEGEKIKNLNKITSKNLKNLTTRIDKALSILNDGPLRSNLEKLGNILKGIGLINSSLQEERVVFNLIPAVINGYPTTVELKIFYYFDSELKTIDKNRFSFELTVNAPKIGPVVISSAVVNNNVSVHIKKSQLPEEVFINQKELLEKLVSQEGYNLGNFLVQYIFDPNTEEGVNFIS